jgi:intein/homing endonuclease
VDYNTEQGTISYSNIDIRDDEPEATIKVEFEGDQYSEKKKLTSRSISTFSSTVADLFVKSDEYSDALERHILSHKSEVFEEAKIRNAEKGFDDEERLEEILTILYEQGGSEPIEPLEQEYPRLMQVVDNNPNLLLNTGDKIKLTDMGRSKAKSAQGYEAFDGDPSAEAEKQLEEDPLGYYLDCFESLHIGDELLKIWELCSALSSVCADRQIHSWAVGPSGKGKSLSGSTPVFVKKEDGWHIETMRKLSQEYEGQDWKTVGLKGSTLETVETQIEDVLAHRNQRRLVEIETRSGREITGTLDHSFLKHKQGEAVPATGEELEEGDYIPVLKGHGFSEQFQAEESIGFLMGMYLAEGLRHSKQRIHIVNFDETAREKVKQVCRDNGIEFSVIRDGDISIDISDHKEIFSAAKTGSGAKVVPPEAFTYSEEFQRQLLKGYFAGDGIDTEQPGYMTKSRDLGLGISMLLSDFEIVTTHREKVVDGRTFYRHRIAKPVSMKKFYEEIGFDREESREFEEREIQQYTDRVPVDYDDVKRFLSANKFSDQSGRNRILTADHVRDTEEIGRHKLGKALNLYDYDVKTPYIRQLERNLNSDVFWDRIETIDAEEEKSRHRVYDISAGEVPHFLLANGAIVHNSHIKRCLCDHLLPEESYKKITGISPKALLYKTNEQGNDFLNDQVVYFDEVDDFEEVANLLRSITDQDEDLVEYTTVREQKPVTIEMYTDSITVWFTSVNTFADEQLKNRFILTNPDGSSDLDQEVFDFQQERLHKGEPLDKPPAEAPVIQRIVQNIREQTPHLSAVVPFRLEWKQADNRRLYPYFYTLMGLVVKIHYKNREVRDGKIMVTFADFKLAKKIWSSIIETTVTQTDEDSIRLLKELPKTEANAMTRSELRLQLSGFNTSKVRDKIENLEETEELQLVNTKKNDSNEYEHWAGEDVDKLDDNEPEIVDPSEETVRRYLSASGIEPTDELVESVMETELGVNDRLKTDDDITEEERRLIDIMKEYNFETDINTLENLIDDIDVFDLSAQLEEKGVIRLDGDNVPSPASEKI